MTLSTAQQIANAIKAHERRLHGAPPAIPAGSVVIKDFSDGTLAPFKVQTYPNDHPGDEAVKYGDFVTDLVSVHDCYLDLRCVRAGARWRQSMVSTGLGGTPYAATHSEAPPVKLSFAARMNSGVGAWQAFWTLANILDWQRAQEIDAAEVIGGALTGNVHPNTARFYSKPTLDTNWHIFTLDWRAASVTVLIDGVLAGQIARAMPAPMSIIIDNKVGLTAPDASTPDLYFHVAWIVRAP